MEDQTITNYKLNEAKFNERVAQFRQSDDLVALRDELPLSQAGDGLFCRDTGGIGMFDAVCDSRRIARTVFKSDLDKVSDVESFHAG